MTIALELIEEQGGTGLEEITAECPDEVAVSLSRLGTHASCGLDGRCEIASALAHDFNDMLSAIIGYATMVHDELEQASPHKDDLAEILRVSRAASEIAKHLAEVSLQMPHGNEESCKSCGE